jgi:tRNA modification GTPase
LKQLILNLKSEIEKLKSSFLLGNVLKNGVNTAIAGRPNAGKSTLLNVLLNEERAIVSEIPGTTRDSIEEILNIEGIQFRLIDTAGIREAEDVIEKIGVEKTMEKIRQSAIVIYLLDVNETSVDEVKADMEKLHLHSIPSLLVANKIDTLGEDAAKKKFSSLSPLLFISAKNHSHIDELKKQLLELVLNKRVKTTDTIVSNIRHYDALVNTEEALAEAMNGLSDSVTKELLALDIKRALSFLGEITGEITNEDLLDNIFSKFCIGK